ncbi:hypothetical protein [uncultured Dokdonia sp.]|uniref:hypothetical protein n=1 Tax=uncultured Dokdonia sp. TaxID=575653 RepID=UPI002630B4C8|nr:hypothetical protein [uncultured Dokdonia sp.]
MKNIKDFLDFLFEREQEALNADNYKEDFQKYNSIVEEIQTHLYNISAGFNLPILKKPKPDFFYLKTKNKVFPARRYLFKISQYDNKKYNTIWACYTSESDPTSDKVKMLTTCFLIAEINNELKIIVKNRRNLDNDKWEFFGGDDDKTLRLHALGQPKEIIRYMEPLEDEGGLKLYKKDM